MKMTHDGSIIEYAFCWQTIIYFLLFDTEVKQCVVGDPYPVKQLYKIIRFRQDPDPQH